MIKLLSAILSASMLWTTAADAAHFAGPLTGYILLQVQGKGEAWYVNPPDGNRYYLGRPDDAFVIMKRLGLGAKHSLIADTRVFPDSLKGRILLDVERNGEAYYIYPKDGQKRYLGRPADAFMVMKKLSLGVTDATLVNIPLGDIDKPKPVPPTSTRTIQAVPFTAQAPFGDWSDQRQEDGCEEASAIMAVSWARGESLTKEKALDKIIASSDFTKKKYGEYRDLSPQDTLDWIIKDFLGYDRAAVKEKASLETIVAEISKGNLIIAPLNGQMLHNPYFVPPGPPNHMLVIRGYDSEKKVFYTNDPGTRRGELYEYDSRLLYDAIRAYPTGYHELITGIKKDVIVVWK